jgi:hypothetical protein
MNTDRNEIVSTFLMGGLGNQLFQLFTTMAYCIRYRKKLVLPYSESLEVGISRPTYWESFLIYLKRYTTSNPDTEYTNQDLMELPQYREPHHHFKEIPEINCSVIFFGYYQSYRYFENEFDKIMALLNIPELQNKITEEYSDYFDNNYITISMHFRLGDYKEKQDYHPIIPYEYYENALFNILLYRKYTNPYKVLYFCEKDDNDIVVEHIKKLKIQFPHVKFVKVDDEIEDWKQLLIMSCCSNNIIANSSFSWWGGFFNKNPGKFVCYPHIWFGPSAKNNNIDDMFPVSWNHIKW